MKLIACAMVAGPAFWRILIVSELLVLVENAVSMKIANKLIRPADPWLRTHVRIGGRIVKVAPCSMTIVGTVAEWSRWTGMSFDRSGQHAVEGALTPVTISLEHDHGTYVEPNVWVQHRL